MALSTLESYYENYRQTFGGDDVKALDLYSPGGEKIGSVAEALVDQGGRFRYLVIQMSSQGSGKQILLPIGLAKIEYQIGKVITQGMSREQVENLAEYKDGMAIDPYHDREIPVINQAENISSDPASSAQAMAPNE